MKTLEEIKKLMVAGETSQADEALKELLAMEPENLQAKMLYGTCRQLLGDEETFKRIHDELAPMMEKLEDDPPTADTIVPTETLSLWKKYHALWMTLIIGGLVLASGIYVMGRAVVNQFNVASTALAGYRGPVRSELCRMPPDGSALSDSNEHSGKMKVDKRFNDKVDSP